MTVAVWALAAIAAIEAVTIGVVVWLTNQQQRRFVNALLLEHHPQAYAATIITEHRRKARGDEKPKPVPSLDEVP